MQPHLEKSRHGSIIVISTTAALEASARADPYGALKAALINYSSNLLQTLATSGIRINAVSLGRIFFLGGAWEQIKERMPDFMTSLYPESQSEEWELTTKLRMQ